MKENTANEEQVLLVTTKWSMRGRKVILRTSNGAQEEVVVDDVHGSFYDGAKLKALRENGEIIALMTPSKRAFRMTGKYKGFEKTPSQWPVFVLIGALITFALTFYVLEMYAESQGLQMTYTPMIFVAFAIVAFMPVARRIYNGYRSSLLDRLNLNQVTS